MTTPNDEQNDLREYVGIVWIDALPGKSLHVASRSLAEARDRQTVSMGKTR